MTFFYERLSRLEDDACRPITIGDAHDLLGDGLRPGEAAELWASHILRQVLQQAYDAGISHQPLPHTPAARALVASIGCLHAEKEHSKIIHRERIISRSRALDAAHDLAATWQRLRKGIFHPAPPLPTSLTPALPSPISRRVRRLRQR